MSEAQRLRYLSLALRVLGVFCIVGIYPLTVLWPSGWAWHVGRSEYLEMLMAIYATMGVFLILAARNPGAHLSLIAFAIWSSVVHGTVMAYQALVTPEHIHHLLGDVPALFAVAALLGTLSPAALRLRF